MHGAAVAFAFMRIRTVSIVALVALSACSIGQQDSDRSFNGDNPLAPASEEEIRAAVDAFHPGVAADHVERSALNSLTAQRQSELTPVGTGLAGLLPSPDGFGAFRLASLQVDDPNGNGRIGEYWYPPRVLRGECSAKIDAAPGPVAAANYVPGSGPLGPSNPTDAFELMSSAVTVSVQVQVFDDAAQRDSYLATTVEFYRDPSFTCGGQQSSVQTFRESTLSTSGAAAVVFEAQPAIFGTGVSSYAAVGDRVLLVVSVSSDDVEAPWVAEDFDRWLAPVIDVALQRLNSTVLP
ncbi:MAG TPA: hypothetical protein DCQ04_14435 [Actinobacteria bacterium]|nr:hypothetical protein [Actinomycetota bacterium]